jgi:hypothetical protein
MSEEGTVAMAEGFLDFVGNVFHVGGGIDIGIDIP